MSHLAARIAAVRERITRACERAGRSPQDVRLIGASKTVSAQTVALAVAAGLHDFGENRVQEGAQKIEELRAAGVRPVWHFFGHLQTNKAAAALDHFDILHGIDSDRIAKAVSDHARGRVGVLVEVNVAGELSKFGLTPSEAPAMCERIGRFPHIDLLGLMTVAPAVDDPQDARPIFGQLRALRNATGLRELSMGMTDDFEVAIEEGATMVRIGRAIFGERGEG
jgi:pyridoxal phosphate enzyme (YggS family)